MTEFVARGTPKSLSREIEAFARGRGSVSAIEVPWESDATTIRLAVTSVRADGWAIEHTNLGTIALTDLGDGTRVAISAQAPDHAEAARLMAVFERFAEQLQKQFAPAAAP